MPHIVHTLILTENNSIKLLASDSHVKLRPQAPPVTRKIMTVLIMSLMARSTS